MARVEVLAVRPHPDDECTGTGGILAFYASRGVSTGVLTCTLGEEGEILDPDLDPIEARPRLGQIREGELRAACRTLGVAELRLLGYRDSGMDGTEANQRPDAFCNAPLDDAGQRVAEIIRELRPQVLITENQFGTYGHPDHVMCHQAALRGVDLAGEGHGAWQVPRVFTTELVMDGGTRIASMLRAEHLDLGWFENAGEELAGFGIKPAQAHAAVDVGDYVHIMRDALAQHRTQIPPDSFLLTWPPHIMREVFRTAYFRLSGSDGNGAQLQDLMEGL